MSKAILNAYRGFTATAIKNRATVPDAADMTVVGTTVECADIDIEKIRDALGITSLDFNAQANDAVVNPWSGFGPAERSVSGQEIVNFVADPDGLFEWAGYNHTAITPGWQTGGLAAATADLWVDSGGDAVFSVNVNVGEVQYQNISPAIVGICLAIYNDTGNLVAWGVRNFDGASVQNDVTNLQATLSGVTLEHTYTGRIWLVDDTSDFDDTQQVCYLPNTAAFAKTVKIKTASVWYYSDGGTQTIPSPWTQNGAAGMNWTTGYFDIGMIATNNSYGSSFRIVATLRDWNNDVIGTADIYSGAYNALDDITGSVYLNMTNIPAYGYKVIIEFLY